MKAIMLDPRTRISLSFWLVFTVLISAFCGRVQAQEHFAIEAFEPAVDPSVSVLNVYGAHVREPGGYSVSLMGSYGRRPLTIEDGASGKVLGDLLGSIGTLQLMGAIGVTRRFDVGFSLPVHRVGAGSDFAITPPDAVVQSSLSSAKVALGDLRLVPRVGLVQHEGDTGFDLALLAPVFLPTGDKAAYAGEPFRIEPRVAASFTRQKLLLAANIGYLIRSRAQVLDTRVDDMLRWGLGSEIPLVGILSGLLEVDGQFNVLNGAISKANAPTEGLAGLRIRAGGFLGQLGGGPGIVRGVGAPTFRVFASVGYSGESVKPKHDRDGDGLFDDVDACPTQPEDRDGFEDDNGCPDPDNDGDGVLDAEDLCPAALEDTDDFEDDDGCLDPDDDRDGIPDVKDACPREAEDREGFKDEDGCPDPDNDGDGVLDRSDRCPLEVGVVEHAGCPAPPATVAAPEPAPLAQVKDSKIELGETVFFGRNNSTIQERSFPLLDSVAKLLADHPEIELVLVEGHTDSTGTAEYNETLSNQRAKSVMSALVKRGIAKERLRAQGFGMRRPIASNKTSEGRAQNRRVELRIERSSAAGAQASPAAPAPAAPPPATP